MADTTLEIPALLTISDLAVLLNTSQRSIYRFAENGTLPRPFRLGCQPRWRRDEITEWIRAGMPPRAAWESEVAQ